MLGSPSERLSQLDRPLVDALALPAVHQIDARARKRRGGLVGGAGIVSAVNPSEQAEVVVAQGLDAD